MKIKGRGNTLDYFATLSATKTKLFLTFEIMRGKVFGHFFSLILVSSKAKYKLNWREIKKFLKIRKIHRLNENTPA